MPSQLKPSNKNTPSLVDKKFSNNVIPLYQKETLLFGKDICSIIFGII